MSCSLISVANYLTLLAKVLVAVSGDGDCSDNSTTPAVNGTNTIDDFRIISREEWNAQPPESPPYPLSILPPPYVIISHTATEPCSTQAQCSERLRVTQMLHVEGNGWDDIGYNFLVGGDGNVYMGRGWDVEGTHTFNYNKKSLGISFIGTFNSAEPTEKQLAAALTLLDYAVKNGKLSTDYKLLGHRQLTETLSPGDVLYEIIKKWPHWSAKP